MGWLEGLRQPVGTRWLGIRVGGITSAGIDAAVCPGCSPWHQQARSISRAKVNFMTNCGLFRCRNRWMRLRFFRFPFKERPYLVWTRSVDGAYRADRQSDTRVYPWYAKMARPGNNLRKNPYEQFHQSRLPASAPRGGALYVRTFCIPRLRRSDAHRPSCAGHTAARRRGGGSGRRRRPDRERLGRGPCRGRGLGAMGAGLSRDGAACRRVPGSGAADDGRF